MFTFILAVCLTVAWSLLYFKTLRDYEKHYDELYKSYQILYEDFIMICSNNAELRNEMQDLRQENRRLKEAYESSGMMILKEATE